MSSNRYAVICAPHLGNSGMFSVDLAAKNFFTSRNADFSLFIPQFSRLKNSEFSDYLSLASASDLDGYTHVVYWGDFLNNPVYGRANYSKRAVKWGINIDEAEAFQEWQALFAPTDPFPGVKYVSAGCNFQHDFCTRKTRFKHVFEAIGSSFSHIYPRDPVGVQSLSTMLGYKNMLKVRQGIDCAFLQAKPRDNIVNSNFFAYFFGRSKLGDVSSLIQQVETKTGLRGVELKNWLRLGAKGTGSWQKNFDSMKDEIGMSQFVLTDAYHLCINSIHSSRPVVCIGRIASEQRGTLGDFKKKILFQMFDLDPFYLEISKDQGVEGENINLAERIMNALMKFRVLNDPYYLVKARIREFSSLLDSTLGFK
jgi:hypothetical protein